MEYDMSYKVGRSSEPEAISVNDPMTTTPHGYNETDTSDNSAIKHAGDKTTIDDILTTSDEEAPSDRYLSEGNTSDYLSHDDYLSDNSSEDSFYTAPKSPLPPTELNELIQACNDSTERENPRTNTIAERITERINDNNNLGNEIKDKLKEIGSERQKLNILRLEKRAREVLLEDLNVQPSKPKKDPTININPFTTARSRNIKPNPMDCRDHYMGPRMACSSKPVIEQQRSTFSFGKPPPLDPRPAPLGPRPAPLGPRPPRLDPRTTHAISPARTRYMSNPPMNTRARYESNPFMNTGARYESNPPMNTRTRYESNLPMNTRARYESNLSTDVEYNNATSACPTYPRFHPKYPTYPKIYPLLIRSNRSTRPICPTIYPPPILPTHRRRRDDTTLER